MNIINYENFVLNENNIENYLQQIRNFYSKEDILSIINDLGIEEGLEDVINMSISDDVDDYIVNDLKNKIKQEYSLFEKFLTKTDEEKLVDELELNIDDIYGIKFFKDLIIFRYKNKIHMLSSNKAKTKYLNEPTREYSLDSIYISKKLALQLIKLLRRKKSN
jgi:hypothetical protein